MMASTAESVNNATDSMAVLSEGRDLHVSSAGKRFVRLMCKYVQVCASMCKCYRCNMNE
jgi:hypothetical protein